MKKIAYFGGSFNPPTIAHLAIVQVLCSMFDEVWIVPNGDVYHYQDKSLTRFTKRVDMLKLMFQDNPKVIIQLFDETSEFKGTEYRLKVYNHPTFVMGSDCFVDIVNWKNSEVLIRDNSFLVFPRGNFTNELFEKAIKEEPLLCKYSKNFSFLSYPIPNVSSTTYRLNQKDELVTKEVNQYIKENHLYEV